MTGGATASGAGANAGGATGGASRGSYTVADLGTLGGILSQAVDVNETGAVAGVSALPDDARHGFVYDRGAMSEIGTLGGTISVGYAINENGAVTGYSTLPTGSYRAFLYSDGKMTDLGSIGGADYSSGAAINSLGHVVGESAVAGSDRHDAFLYRDGTMIDLGTLGGEYSSAHGINDAGRIVGYSYRPEGVFHGFLLEGGEMVDLGTLGGSYSKAYGINEAGDVVGLAYLAGDAQAHAFLYRAGSDGSMIDLDTMGHAHSEALAINAQGAVVGDFDTAGDGVVIPRAFLFTDGQMRDLNDLIGQGSGWLLNVASGINDAGQIAGWGTFQGQQHAFLLSPTAL